MPFSDNTSSPPEQFSPPGSSTVDRVLSIILLFVLLIAIAITVYVIVSPKESEHFSEFFILGENQKAADYPADIITGFQYPMFIGVGNHE